MIRGGKCSIFTPQHLLAAIWRRMPMFRGYIQQDAEELLYMMLENLDQELRRTHSLCTGIAPDQAHVVTKLFEGFFESSIQCSSCGTVTSRREKFFSCVLFPPSLSSCYPLAVLLLVRLFPLSV